MYKKRFIAFLSTAFLLLMVESELSAGFVAFEVYSAGTAAIDAAIVTGSMASINDTFRDIGNINDEREGYLMEIQTNTKTHLEFTKRNNALYEEIRAIQEKINVYKSVTVDAELLGAEADIETLAR